MNLLERKLRIQMELLSYDITNELIPVDLLSGME